jgi:hypothetical protein
MTTREVLVAMRELLAKPEAWTQGAYARDASGRYVSLVSQEASCWCIGGALLKCSRMGGNYDEVLFKLGGIFAGDSISAWNDAPERTHADVLALLDRAIAEAS